MSRRVLDEEALRRSFAPLEAARAVALAVSGGADSLALVLLARRWRELCDAPPSLMVLTVDHGLRPESAAEAADVARIAAGLGLECRLLRWAGPYPTADIEAAAREARYSLLLAAAREAGIAHIATAHHRDDQAETFLLRLARGTGVYGLAGMARSIERDGVRIVRPLLDIAHADLVEIVHAAGLVPALDPHNHDHRFARARMRALAPALAREGMTAERLAATAARLRRAAAAIDHYAGRLFAAAADVDPLGVVRLDAAAWRAEPEEVRLRALARVLRAAGGAEHVPRLERLAALEAGLGTGEAGRRTLSGVVVTSGAGEIRFERELGRAGLAEISVIDGFDGVWDGRFRIRLSYGGITGTLAALGPAGRLGLPAESRAGGSPRAIEALPALWSNGELVAIPALGIVPPASDSIRIEVRCIVGDRLAEGIAGEES